MKTCYDLHNHELKTKQAPKSVGRKMVLSISSCAELDLKAWDLALQIFFHREDSLGAQLDSKKAASQFGSSWNPTCCSSSSTPGHTRHQTITEDVEVLQLFKGQVLHLLLANMQCSQTCCTSLSTAVEDQLIEFRIEDLQCLELCFHGGWQIESCGFL